MKRCLLALIVLVGLAVWPVAAQDAGELTPEDLENLEFVAAAYDNTFGLGSFSQQGRTVIVQDVSVEGASVTQEIDQDIAAQYVQAEAGEFDMSAQIDQTISMAMPGQPTTDGGMTMEFILADETLYLRISEAEGDFAGLFPNDRWQNVTEDPSALFGLIDPETYVDTIKNQWNYPITAESITAINELRAVQGEDGQELRVFVLTYNVPYLFESDALKQLLGAFDETIFGGDAEAFMNDFVDGMEMKMTVGVGGEDNLLHTLDGEINTSADINSALTDGMNVHLDQQISITIAFGDFNESFEITAPDQSMTDASTPNESVAVPIQSRDHIASGQDHPAYNSNPPTSGWHYASPARAGVYEEELPDETVIHNLEHGQVWLSYRDADDEDALELLADLEREFSGWVIVTYRPGNDQRVAASAWGRLLTLDELDEEALRAFIERYRNQAPESIPG